MSENGRLSIALVTHRFLEPTHHGMAMLVARLADCEFHVYAKEFTDHFTFENVVERVPYSRGPLTFGPDALDVVHAVYDGRTALRAGRAAVAAGLPFILSFHGGFDTNAKIFDSRYSPWTRAVATRADALTVVGPSDVQRLRRLGVQRPIVVLPVAIDLHRLPRPSKRNPFSLLVVARLVPKKGGRHFLGGTFSSSRRFHYDDHRRWTLPARASEAGF
ncbi:MAG: glycosyltransferase [bacterium]